MDIYELTAFYTASIVGFLLLSAVVAICCMVLTYKPSASHDDLEH